MWWWWWWCGGAHSRATQDKGCATAGLSGVLLCLFAAAWLVEQHKVIILRGKRLI